MCLGGVRGKTKFLKRCCWMSRQQNRQTSSCQKDGLSQSKLQISFYLKKQKQKNSIGDDFLVGLQLWLRGAQVKLRPEGPGWVGSTPAGSPEKAGMVGSGSAAPPPRSRCPYQWDQERGSQPWAQVGSQKASLSHHSSPSAFPPSLYPPPCVPSPFWLKNIHIPWVLTTACSMRKAFI